MSSAIDYIITPVHAGRKAPGWILLPVNGFAGGAFALAAVASAGNLAAVWRQDERL